MTNAHSKAMVQLTGKHQALAEHYCIQALVVMDSFVAIRSAALQVSTLHGRHETEVPAHSD